MKRSIRLYANDGRTKVRIVASIECSELTRDEVAMVASDITRRIASAIAGVRYTDFGIDNTRVGGK